MNEEKSTANVFLFIGSTGIGENLSAIPSLLYLKEHFNVIFLGNAKTTNVFQRLNLGLKLITCEENAYSFEIKNIIHAFNVKYWCYRFFYQNSTILKDLQAYNFDHYCQLQTPYVCYFNFYSLNSRELTVSEKLFYYLATRLEPLDPSNKTLNTNTVVNLHTSKWEEMLRLHSTKNTNKIVLYKGSWEFERKTTNDTLIILKNALLNVLGTSYEYTFLAPQEDLYYIKQQDNSNFFSKYVEDTATENIIRMFQEGVKLFIGPDSGLNWLARVYGISELLLESRAPQSIVNFLWEPSSSKRESFKKPLLTCKQNCLSCMFANEGTINPFHANACKYKDHPLLECAQNSMRCVNCLDYDSQDIKKITEIACNLIKNNAF